LISSQTPLYI
jgi:hypothetical protein